MHQLDLDTATQAQQLRTAVAHLEKCDKRFTTLFENHGLPKFTVSKNFFFHLVKSIVYQQLAGSAAQKIFGRFLDLFQVAAATQALSSESAVFFQEDNHPYLTPAKVLELDFEVMRGVGLSTRKAEYIQDLAKAVITGQLDVTNIRMMPDEQVVAQITSVRGLGPWTADMFKMYGLGRLDVLPTGDLGVRKGFAMFFSLSKVPTPEEMHRLATPWAPYRSVGAYYMWKVLESKAQASKSASPLTVAQAVLSVVTSSSPPVDTATTSTARSTPSKRKSPSTKKEIKTEQAALKTESGGVGGGSAVAAAVLFPLQLRQKKAAVLSAPTAERTKRHASKPPSLSASADAGSGEAMAAATVTKADAAAQVQGSVPAAGTGDAVGGGGGESGRRRSASARRNRA